MSINAKRYSALRDESVEMNVAPKYRTLHSLFHLLKYLGHEELEFSINWVSYLRDILTSPRKIISVPRDASDQ